MGTAAIERRIRWAGILVVLGLIVQLLTRTSTHPLAFITFLLIGCPLVAAGVLLYLYSLVAVGSQEGRSPSSLEERT